MSLPTTPIITPIAGTAALAAAAGYIYFRGLVNEADKIAAQQGFTEQNGGNAFRHAYTSAELQRNFGPDYEKYVK